MRDEATEVMDGIKRILDNHIDTYHGINTNLASRAIVDYIIKFNASLDRPGTGKHRGEHQGDYYGE